MTRFEGAARGPGGMRLYYRGWEVPAPRAALVIVHGHGEHSGRYEGFAASMAGYGISCYGMDLRGHGQSDGRRGHARSFDALLQDVDRFRREVEGLVDDRTPLFLLGQSMGGLLVLRFLEEYRSHFRGALVISPWLATAMRAPRWKVMAGNLFSRVFPALPFRSGINPEHLCSDPAIVRRYREDPWVHSILTPRLFTEVSAAMGRVSQRADRIAVPLFFGVGRDDPIVDPERTLALARSLGGRTEVTIRVWEGMLHEPLNEPGRDQVIREMRDWMIGRLNP
jgi:alpha-beta hydrolase superfamily lysophospholipase